MLTQILLLQIIMILLECRIKLYWHVIIMLKTNFSFVMHILVAMPWCKKGVSVLCVQLYRDVFEPAQKDHYHHCHLLSEVVEDS